MNQKPSYRDLKRAIENAAALLRVRETQVNYLINEIRKLKPDHDIFTKTVKEVVEMGKAEKPLSNVKKGDGDENEDLPLRGTESGNVRGKGDAGERGGELGNLPASEGCLPVPDNA